MGKEVKIQAGQDNPKGEYKKKGAKKSLGIDNKLIFGRDGKKWPRKQETSRHETKKRKKQKSAGKRFSFSVRKNTFKQ